MIYKSSLIILLAMSANLSIGCTKYVDVSFDEVRSDPELHVKRVVCAEVIKGVIEHDGDTISFGEPYGHYESATRVMSGVTVDGDSVAVRLNRIRSVLIYCPAADIENYEKIGRRDFLHSVNRGKWERRRDRFVRRGEKVFLRNQSGRIGPEYDSFRGVSLSGDPISVRHHNAFLQRAKTDIAGSVALVTGPIIVVGIIVGIHIRHNPPFGGSLK